MEDYEAHHLDISSSHRKKPTPPSDPPRLILGSSLIKHMRGIKSTRIQSIPGAHFYHLSKWAQSSEGRQVLKSKFKIILLCGGNSLSDGASPNIVLEEAKSALQIIKSLAKPECKIFLSSLPPRPEIDNRSNSRQCFNRLLRNAHFHEGLLITEAENGLIDYSKNCPKPQMLKQEEFKRCPRRDIVHLSEAGVDQLRHTFTITLGKATHSRAIHPFIIKKKEIGRIHSYHL
jgi:hypothetical protein